MFFVYHTPAEAFDNDDADRVTVWHRYEVARQAVRAGLYENPLMGRHYPRVQILTIEELLNGKQPSLPPRVEAGARLRIGQQTAQATMDMEPMAEAEIHQ